jgi:hypothetical protein
LQGDLSQGGLATLERYLRIPGLQRSTLQIRLCLIVAIILAPALVLAGMLSLRSIQAERVHIEEGLGRTLNQLSVEIDREIQGTTDLLTVLAGSHYLKNGDLEGFHRRASEFSDALGKCLPLCHQRQTFVRNAALRLNLRCQARFSSNKLRVDRAPSMPVGDNECRDPERLGQAKRLLELRVGWAYRLEISSSLCCQAHEKNAA